MFNFDQYTKNTNRVCSTNKNVSEYESCLIQVLALPLATQSRDLSLPYTSKSLFQDFKTNGEPNKNVLSGEDMKYTLQGNPVNEISFKINLMNKSNCTEDTHFDSISNEWDNYTPTEVKSDTSDSIN